MMSRRRGIDPDGLTLQPKETPVFELNSRQLELMKRRQEREHQREPSTVAAPSQPFLTRSNLPQAQVVKSLPDQKAYLRQFLSTAKSTASDQSDDGKRALMKKILAKTISQKKHRAQPTRVETVKPPNKQRKLAPREKKLESASHQLRERFQKVKLATVEPPPPPPPKTEVEEKPKFRHDEKLKQRISARYKQRDLPQTKKNINEGFVEGYDEFLKTLQQEVSGQHSQLLSSFLAILRGEKVPDTIVVRNIKPYKFDPPTKQTLALMNVHLKSKHAACEKASQLVNDKKWLKERAQNAGSSTSEQASFIKPGRPDTNNNINIQRCQDKDSTNTEKNEATERRPTFNAEARSESLVPKVDAILQVRSSEDSQCFVTRDSLDKHRSMQPLTDILSAASDDAPSPTAHNISRAADDPSPKSFSGAVSDVGSAAAIDLESSSNPGVEVTLKQFETKVKYQPQTPSESGSIPWSDVQLKPVNKPSSLDVSIENNEAPLWANLKLRRVEQAAPETGNMASPVDESRADPDVTKNPLSDISSNEISNAAPKVQTKEENSRREKIDEGAAVFPLKNDSGDEEEPRIIVGKKVLMLVKSKIGDSQAIVLWKLARESIDSMSLDMATLEVKLALLRTDKTKQLCFSTPEDCLKFANAYYDMTNTTSTNEEGLELVSNDSSDPIVPQLSEEEKSVLETYRRLRLTKPAEDALEATVQVKQESLSLSTSEEGIVDKFRRMLKLGVPIEGVEHKMKVEGVPPKIYNAVVSDFEGKPLSYVAANEMPMSPVSTMSASVALSAGELEVAASYRKMLRVNIPPDTVREQMQKDSVDPKIVAFVLDDYWCGSENKSVQSDLTGEEEIVANKYRMMLKLGVPAEGVHHKMIQDGVDAKIVTAVLGDRKLLEKDQTTFLGTNKNKSSLLNEDEQSQASQYKKMLKAGVPKELVARRMEEAGIPEKVMRSVVGVSASQKSETNDKKSSHSNKLVPLHWTPLSGQELDDGSVWRASNSRRDLAVVPEGSDISKLIEMFQKKSSTTSVKINKGGGASDSSGKALLLDLTRSNNIAISLKAFKEFTFQELADIIRFLDPSHKVKGERVQFIRDLLPTAAEVNIVQAYRGSDDKLVPAEIWFKHIHDIQRIETKAGVLRTIEVFESEAKEVSSNFQLLATVCHQVISSQKLLDVLSMVLRIGNIMNEGTRTGGAVGFKFDSLLKLTQTKSSDGKSTVLDFLVNIFVAKGKRETLKLSMDFPDCQTASRMVVSDLITEVKQMEESLKCCKQELEDLRAELNPTSLPVESSSVSDKDPQHSLLSAIVKRDSDDCPLVSKSSVSSLRDKFLDAANDEKKSRPVDTAHSSSEKCVVENSTQGAISRLEKFVDDSRAIFSDLKSVQDATLDVCKSLSKYCAESGGYNATSSLLGILHEFALNIDSALKKYDEKKAVDDRHAKAKHQTVDFTGFSKLSPALHTELSSDNDKSLVLMVNELLKGAPEHLKDDFRKGRMSTNPTQTLKAIYEKEQQRLRIVSTNNRSSLSIVSALQEQEVSVDQEEEQQARSKFSQLSSVSNEGSPSRITNGLATSDIESNGADQVDLIESQFRLFKTGKRTPERPLLASRDLKCLNRESFDMSGSQRRLSCGSNNSVEHLLEEQKVVSTAIPISTTPSSKAAHSLSELAKQKRASKHEITNLKESHPHQIGSKDDEIQEANIQNDSSFTMLARQRRESKKLSKS